MERKKWRLSLKDELWTLVDENNSVLSINEQCSIIGLKRSVYYEKRSSNGDEEKQKAKLEKETEHDKRCDTVLNEWTEYDTYGYTLRCLSIYLDRVSHGLQNLL